MIKLRSLARVLVAMCAVIAAPHIALAQSTTAAPKAKAAQSATNPMVTTRFLPREALNNQGLGLGRRSSAMEILTVAYWFPAIPNSSTGAATTASTQLLFWQAAYEAQLKPLPIEQRVLPLGPFAMALYDCRAFARYSAFDDAFHLAAQPYVERLGAHLESMPRIGRWTLTNSIQSVDAVTRRVNFSLRAIPGSMVNNRNEFYLPRGKADPTIDPDTGGLRIASSTKPLEAVCDMRPAGEWGREPKTAEWNAVAPLAAPLRLLTGQIARSTPARSFNVVRLKNPPPVAFVTWPANAPLPASGEQVQLDVNWRLDPATLRPTPSILGDRDGSDLSIDADVVDYTITRKSTGARVSIAL